MDESRIIGLRIKKLSCLIRRHIDNHATQMGIADLTGMQSWIIRYMSELPSGQEIFQRDMEKKFNIRRSTITGIIQLMEKRGLITRHPVSYDARLKKLELTQKAIDINTLFKEDFVKFEDKMRRGISDEDLDVFFKVIDKIKNNIND